MGSTGKEFTITPEELILLVLGQARARRFCFDKNFRQLVLEAAEMYGGPWRQFVAEDELVITNRLDDTISSLTLGGKLTRIPKTSWLFVDSDIYRGFVTFRLQSLPPAIESEIGEVAGEFKKRVHFDQVI